MEGSSEMLDHTNLKKGKEVIWLGQHSRCIERVISSNYGKFSHFNRSSKRLFTQDTTNIPISATSLGQISPRTSLIQLLQTAHQSKITNTTAIMKLSQIVSTLVLFINSAIAVPIKAAEKSRYDSETESYRLTFSVAREVEASENDFATEGEAITWIKREAPFIEDEFTTEAEAITWI
jgi:hypothetical protein